MLKIQAKLGFNDVIITYNDIHLPILMFYNCVIRWLFDDDVLIPAEILVHTTARTTLEVVWTRISVGTDTLFTLIKLIAQLQ